MTSGSDWVDLGVAGLLLLSALVGLARGFVREALGLFAWVGAAILATRFYGVALPTARRLITDDAVADPVAFLVVFVALLIVLLVVAGLLGRLVRGTLLGGVDRLAGLVFGLLRGFAVLVILYLVVVPVLPVAEWPPMLRTARSLPVIGAGAAWVAPHLPDRFRPDLSPSAANKAMEDRNGF